jgi:hypothetical protein
METHTNKPSLIIQFVPEENGLTPHMVYLVTVNENQELDRWANRIGALIGLTERGDGDLG